MNMALFDGNSFLTSNYDIFTGINYGNYELYFKYKPFNSAQSMIWGVEGDIEGIPGEIIFQNEDASGRLDCRILDGSSFPFLPTTIPDNVVHDIGLKRLNIGGHDCVYYTKKDTGEWIEADGGGSEDWDLYSALLAETGIWAIGKGGVCGNKTYNNFHGLISEFKFYKDGVLFLYLPLTSDFADHSGNDIPIVNNGCTLVDDTLTKTSFVVAPKSGSNIRNIHYYNGAWIIYEPGGYAFAGNENVYGFTKSGFVINFEFIPPIPAGRQIVSSLLKLLGRSYAGLTSGTGTKTKIVAELNNEADNISTVSDYQAMRGTDVGGTDNTHRTVAEVDWNDITIPVDYVTTPSLNPLISAVQGLGEIKELNLFIDDHAGQSSANHTYIFDRNDVGGYDIELTVEIAPLTPSSGKKVMIRKG